MNLASIPSPEQSTWFPFGDYVPIRAYALCIILGVVAAVLLTRKRWAARGGDPVLVLDVASWAVPFGVVGGRLYHVVTSYEPYFGPQGDPWAALYIWRGGLGIWGAVAFGALGAWIACRRHGILLPPLADAIAPGLALAQAVGRWGNWFNQELYGAPTTLPWGLEISPMFRPAATPDIATYHPTFLYECLWNLGVAGLVILADRRWRLGHGRAFALYVAAYCAGRGWIEYLRVDEAHHVLGLRLNVWTSIVVFLGAVVYFVLSARLHPGREESVDRRRPEVEAVAEQPAKPVVAVPVPASPVQAPVPAASEATELLPKVPAEAGVAERKPDPEVLVSGAEEAAAAQPASETAAAAEPPKPIRPATEPFEPRPVVGEPADEQPTTVLPVVEKADRPDRETEPASTEKSTASTDTVEDAAATGTEDVATGKPEKAEKSEPVEEPAIAVTPVTGDTGRDSEPADSESTAVLPTVRAEAAAETAVQPVVRDAEQRAEPAETAPSGAGVDVPVDRERPLTPPRVERGVSDDDRAADEEPAPGVVEPAAPAGGDSAAEAGAADSASVAAAEPDLDSDPEPEAEFEPEATRPADDADSGPAPAAEPVADQPASPTGEAGDTAVESDTATADRPAEPEPEPEDGGDGDAEPDADQEPERDAEPESDRPAARPDGGASS